MIYKINGRKVTKKEWDQHTAKRASITGNLMDDMLRSRQAPRGLTDDVFLSGVGNLDQQFKDDPDGLNHITKEAMKHGYRPRCSDFYNAAIAEYPGDPKAFLNHGQGRGHLKKTLEERGYRQNRDGDVEVVRGPEEDPYQNPQMKLHPSLIRKIKSDRMKDNPDLAHANQRELEEDIVATHGWNESR